MRLTPGYVARHAPARSAQGLEAALIDIAQDLLLREVAERSVLELVAFKGGTALRKVYAGAGGRFSTDLDFAITAPSDDPTAVVELLTSVIDGLVIGPFRYGIEHRRGRAHVTYASELGLGAEMGQLRSKLDVGPPPWLAPTKRPWVPVPIHARYGGPLPELPVVRLEENIAEKIARLNRRTLARDAFDLVWLVQQSGIGFDRELTRRLAVLKCWVDRNGLSSAHHVWATIPDARQFDVARWLAPRARRDFDDEQIGLLTTPPPDLAELGEALPRYYAWLDALDEREAVVAQGDPKDRDLVLTLLAELGERMRKGYW